MIINLKNFVMCLVSKQNNIATVKAEWSVWVWILVWKSHISRKWWKVQAITAVQRSWQKKKITEMTEKYPKGPRERKRQFTSSLSPIAKVVFIITSYSTRNPSVQNWLFVSFHFFVCLCFPPPLPCVPWVSCPSSAHYSRHS